MKTVHQVSALTGVSIRALHHYDKIGLLKPSYVTPAGYRMYDSTALERLEHIMMFRELEFPLKDIARILDSPDFDHAAALEQQLKLLTLKKEHLENLIELTLKIKKTGVNNMDFSAFDNSKMEQYAQQAKAAWGDTGAYKEYEQRTKDMSQQEINSLGENLMVIFKEFGELRNAEPSSEEAQQQVRKLQEYITGHFYTCTPEILEGLGQMYCAGGSMTENIDTAGGPGTADFAAKAIKIYCGK